MDAVSRIERARARGRLLDCDPIELSLADRESDLVCEIREDDRAIELSVIKDGHRRYDREYSNRHKELDERESSR
jgi:hypothetical protein